jgi:hypothetical protein
MALATCRECRGQVSTEARFCPHCGAPRPALAEYTGSGFEWRSARTVMGYPLVHVAIGRDARGKLRVAKGIIAIGQFGVGLITVAQFGVGLLFGFGQFMLGLMAVAQIAVGPLVAVGQCAAGYAAIGQVALGYYGLGQVGWAKFFWGPKHRHPEAVQFFTSWWEAVKAWLAGW